MTRNSVLSFGAVLPCLLAASIPATAQSIEDAIAQSRALSEQKQFDAAGTLLLKALRAEPGNPALRLELARIHSWQGRYDEADRELKTLAKAYPEDADIRFAQANLLIYQGQRDSAALILQELLRQHPENREAREALARMEAAKKNAVRWQLDLGGEYSSFARRSRSAWDSQYLQLTHFSEDGTTSLYGRTQRYWQFDTADLQFELGAAHRFLPQLDGYGHIAYTPDAAFKQKLRLGVGGTVRLYAWDEDRSGLRLTLDGRHDEYRGIAVFEIDPGFRLDLPYGYAFSGRAIVVKPGKTDAMTGWLMRADASLSEHWSGFVGAARAPETVAGTTVETASYFSGINVALTDQLVMRVSYTYADRQTSYIQHVFALGFSKRL